VAVKLGYRNVYRDPLGLPEWEARGFPVERSGEADGPGGGKPSVAGPLHGWSLLWTLLGVFAGGMALNLTPCVYPLLPITLSYFGGRALGDGGRSSLGPRLAHALAYVAGLSVTNALLGTAAALTGGLMGGLLQNSWVLVGVAAVLLVFATSLLGLWELRLPGFFNRLASARAAGYAGSVFMGATLGVVAAPCIGPFVLGLLTWVASLGSPLLGFLIFLTLSLGMGLPLFLLALFSDRLGRLPRSGAWMVWVRAAMGWILAGMAANYLRPLLGARAGNLLLAAVALGAGVHLLRAHGAQEESPWFRRVRLGTALAAAGLLVFFVGQGMREGSAAPWQPYRAGILEEAQARRMPVVLDFSASWCAPCRRLEEETFSDPQVVDLARKGFFLVKVDLTRGDDPQLQALVERFQIRGVPTVVFLDSSGREVRERRLVDFAPPRVVAGIMGELAENGLETTEEDGHGEGALLSQ